MARRTGPGRPRSGRVAMCVRVSETDLVLLRRRARECVPSSSPSTLAGNAVAEFCAELRKSLPSKDMK